MMDMVTKETIIEQLIKGIDNILYYIPPKGRDREKKREGIE